MTLVVGAHPQNLSLSILARRPTAVAALRENGLTFSASFTARASQTIPLMKAGVLHLAGTGATRRRFWPRRKGLRRRFSACPDRARNAVDYSCAKRPISAAFTISRERVSD